MDVIFTGTTTGNPELFVQEEAEYKDVGVTVQDTVTSEDIGLEKEAEVLSELKMQLDLKKKVNHQKNQFHQKKVYQKEEALLEEVVPQRHAGRQKKVSQIQNHQKTLTNKYSYFFRKGFI